MAGKVRALLWAWLVVVQVWRGVVLGDVVMYGSSKGVQMAMVLVPGAQIPPPQYARLAVQLQQAAMLKNISLWVAVPGFVLNMAEPLEMYSAVDRVWGKMLDNGMSKDTRLVLAGHSLGGAMVAREAAKWPAGRVFPAGIVLFNSFITREDRKMPLPMPSLTIGGSLDGLARVTRLMEAAIMQSDEMKAPVVVLQGVNHFSIATGTPPALVKARDLHAEIDSDKARNQMSELVAAFIDIVAHEDDVKAEESFQLMKDARAQTLEFLHPLITAFDAEGFAGFRPPCNNGPVNDSCQIGSTWVEVAQKIMVGKLENVTLNVVDSFRIVWQFLPRVHLPKVLNNCSNLSESETCQLDLTTVSQNMYEKLDVLDTGFIPISATETKAKLSSRQRVLQAAGFIANNFSETDTDTNCAQINSEAYSWALGQADPITLNRFLKYGVPMKFGKDLGPYNAGPLWIWKPLQYQEGQDSQGNYFVEISSPTMRTAVDYPVPAARGFHYCKLLSPARALEWIYVDGLRKHYSLSNFSSESRLNHHRRHILASE